MCVYGGTTGGRKTSAVCLTTLALAHRGNIDKSGKDEQGSVLNISRIPAVTVKVPDTFALVITLKFGTRKVV
jgi:hypothetical protein